MHLDFRKPGKTYVCSALPIPPKKPLESTSIGTPLSWQRPKRTTRMTATKPLPITKTRCGTCALLTHIKGEKYSCPRNRVLRNMPADFAWKCPLYARDSIFSPNSKQFIYEKYKEIHYHYFDRLLLIAISRIRSLLRKLIQPRSRWNEALSLISLISQE